VTCPSSSKKNFSKLPYFSEIGLFSQETYSFGNLKIGLFSLATCFFSTPERISARLNAPLKIGLFLQATCPF
jgi:hypothetical protein